MRSLDDVSFIFLLLYVDDMLMASNHLLDVNDLKSLFSKKFDTKDLGPTKKILGMKIHRDMKSRQLWLSHQGYVEKVLDRFNMRSL